MKTILDLWEEPYYKVKEVIAVLDEAYRALAQLTPGTELLDRIKSVCNDKNIFVGGERSLDRLISLARLSFVDSVVKNFNLEEQEFNREFFVRPFYFADCVGYEYVLKTMGKSGYRPATLIELLTFCMSNKDICRQYSIAACGSRFYDDSTYAYPCIETIMGSDTKLELKILKPWLGENRVFDLETRFLGVRKRDE